MTLEELNQLAPKQLRAELLKCCGSARWTRGLAVLGPYESEEHFLALAEEIWQACEEGDWKEAFTHHPKIGDVKSLEKKYANTLAWASEEQGSVATAPSQVIEELALANKQYEETFGYIFIVCATGKSADEMLAILKKRLKNKPKKELKVAMGEQNKITQLRLQKLLS